MATTGVDASTSRLTWVTDVMSLCSAAIQPRNRQVYCQDVANCFYLSVDEVAKANIAARSTMVSLWPAMISLVSALYPDAADIAHVHIGWAAMFVLTSGGIAGYSMGARRNCYDAPDQATAVAWCKGSTEATVALPTTSPVKAGRNRNLHFVILGLLVCAVAIYAAFAGPFLDILEKTILTWLCEPYWFGSVWYFPCSVPTMLQAMKQVLFTFNTSLYIPGTDAATRSTKYEGGNIGLWWRVLKFQFTKKPYRLLVRRPQETLASSLFNTLIATLRLAVFVFGSVTQ
ncbi:hypothetical protein CC86DRAFT_387051 [Ophiobolus disseminans]|uniref:Uncharacterized protein n=1 Tax=Ophiobolus disseminans TaxID=1469910 RepID=A0A6A6ZK35_9PLEO|nr:hypothetical protein CC86DRAFT_387051 [Ophiobolus disseminans]